MATETPRTRCQRIGCDAFFTEDDNAEESCEYHDGWVCRGEKGTCPVIEASRVHRAVTFEEILPYNDWLLCTVVFKPPLFHDGTKEWSCCKQRSHDFSLFLAIPGCKKGKHTSEKPQTKAAPSPNKPIVSPVTGNAALDAAKQACGRCRQGFFCSDHGSQVGNVNSQCHKLAASETARLEPPAPKPAKIIDLNQPQVCKNKGCGKSFTERDNHETACHYHPGPAVFHDRLRGWQCCDVHVKEFDEFLSIPPCAKGWHNANPDN